MSKSPDEAVSETIVEALRVQRLMGDTSLKDLATRLATGSLRSEDWRVLIEKETAQTKGAGNATKN